MLSNLKQSNETILQKQTLFNDANDDCQFFVC